MRGVRGWENPRKYRSHASLAPKYVCEGPGCLFRSLFTRVLLKSAKTLVCEAYFGVLGVSSGDGGVGVVVVLVWLWWWRCWSRGCVGAGAGVMVVEWWDDRESVLPHLRVYARCRSGDHGRRDGG